MNGNVLQLLNYAAPYSGNFMQSIYSIDKKIKSKCIDTIYLFPIDAAKYRWIQELMSTSNVYFQKTSTVQSIITLAKIINKYNIEIVHVHFWNIHCQLLLKLIKLYKPSIKIVIHFHNHYYSSNKKIKELIKQWLLASDAYIGCSKSVSNSLRVAGINANKIYEVINAVDFERLDYYEKLNIDTLKIPNNSFKILMFGFDYYRKGVDIALGAIEQIYSMNSNCNIVLMVSLSKNNDIINKLIIDKYKKFPEWIVILKPRNDIASYYRIANLFISPSREEGFCYSIIEAAYCKCQIIASDIPGQNENKIPYISFIKPNSVNELSKTIITKYHLKNLDDLEVAKEYVYKEYSIDVWASKIISIYNEISIKY